VHNGRAKVGQVWGCDVYGISQVIPHHPDLYFYDMHGIEMLYTMMGRGCVSVSRVQTPYAEQITGVWKDGSRRHISRHPRRCRRLGIRCDAVLGRKAIRQVGDQWRGRGDRTRRLSSLPRPASRP